MAGRQETQASSGTRGRGGGGGDWGRGRGDGWRGRDRGRSGAPRPPPPDHFVSLRVPSELAAPYFDAAHAALRLHSEGALEPFLVGSETAHVTLAVVRLNGEESKGESGDGKDDENKTADASPATKGGRKKRNQKKKVSSKKSFHFFSLLSNSPKQKNQPANPLNFIKPWRRSSSACSAWRTRARTRSTKVRRSDTQEERERGKEKRMREEIDGLPKKRTRRIIILPFLCSLAPEFLVLSSRF